MGLLLVTPSAAIVTLAEAKAHLRVDQSDDDTLITRLVATATEHLDRRDGVTAIGSQTWELQLDSFPTCDEIEIPLGPLISVASIKYDDEDGAEQTLSTSAYEVDAVSSPGRVVLVSGESWPTADTAVNVVRVRFLVGYSTVPESLKHAALMLVSHWYENREAVASGSSPAVVPLGVDALTSRFHVWHV